MLKPLLAHLDRLPLLPELHTRLHQMAVDDQTQLAGSPQWATVIPAVAQALGGADEPAIATFTAAWLTLYTATKRLDHLQDGDPADAAWFAALPPQEQIHLALSAYALSNSLLATLQPPHIPAERAARLSQRWATTVLQMAGGQYRDLLHLGRGSALDPHTALAYYQELVQHKTGACFALAFAGVAVLLSDEPPLIEALSTAGACYGTLLQYQDDLIDRNDQVDQPLALPALIRQAYPTADTADDQAILTFWRVLMTSHYQHASEALAVLPSEACAQILALFVTTFGTPLAEERP